MIVFSVLQAGVFTQLVSLLYGKSGKHLFEQSVTNLETTLMEKRKLHFLSLLTCKTAYKGYRVRL